MLPRFLVQNHHSWTDAQKSLLWFIWMAYQGRTFLVWGILGFFVLCLIPFQEAGAESTATVSVQMKLADVFPELPWEQSRITVSLLDDRGNLSKQIIELQEESKPQLEALIKEYMYTVELLTHLAVQQDREKEKAQALSSFHVQENHIQHILDGYTAQIEQIFQEQTLQIQREEGRNVRRIEFHEIPPGEYRIHVVLTFATTTLQWFEALTMKGGDTVLCTLTRENLNNPYWTELNWWKFMNLDFSKHH